MMQNFNHHMLTLARNARGVTQAELAGRLNLGQGTLSKYETGLIDPPKDFVGDVAEALGFPAPFFYEGGRPYGMPPFHYRRRKKLSAKTLDRIVAEMNIRRLHLNKLLVSFEWRTNVFIPEIDRDEYHGRGKSRLTVEDVARQVREMWMLPKGPIPNMVELLESKGGIVIPCDFGTDLLDTMSQRIDGMPILFFVNVDAPADRVRHTLAHELGHMVLHTTTLKTDEEMEDEADAFAGAFLLPADEIRPQLRRFDLRQIANLKGYWKVSMAAIAVRATRLSLITPYQSKMFWIEMSRLGYRKREPNEPPKEYPSLFRQMVAFHLNKLGYTVSEVARLLHLRVAEFQEMYRADVLGAPSGGRPQLRIVK
jgi:Zn-dependent peptidase ImmA (M78 family)/DNA-binding XRE family transcriptional regulator